MLNHDDIVTILAIFEHNNFSRAANALYIGQPALSKKVRGIEKRLGYEIFIRNRGGNHVQISRQGMELLPILYKMKQLDDEASDIKSSPPRTQIKIASSDGPYITVIDSAIEKCYQLDNKITYKLKIMPYPACVDAILNDSIDLALIGSNIYRKYVNIFPLYEEHMVFICKSGAAPQSPVDPRRLDLSASIYSPYSSEFSAWFKSTFNNRRPFIQCDLINQVKRFIDTMSFWSIVPYSVAKFIEKDVGVSILPLLDLPPKRLIYYAIKAGNKKGTVLGFLDCIKSVLLTDANITLLG